MHSDAFYRAHNHIPAEYVINNSPLIIIFSTCNETSFMGNYDWSKVDIGSAHWYTISSPRYESMEIKIAKLIPITIIPKSTHVQLINLLWRYLPPKEDSNE